MARRRRRGEAAMGRMGEGKLGLFGQKMIALAGMSRVFEAREGIRCAIGGFVLAGKLIVVG